MGFLVDYRGCAWGCWSGALFFAQRIVCTVLYLPSLITTVSWPGCLRMWTAIVAVGYIYCADGSAVCQKEDGREKGSALEAVAFILRAQQMTV